MKICLIGSTGHWDNTLNAVSRQGPDRIVGIAPGSPCEGMDNVAACCGKIGQKPLFFADYRKMLDVVQPDVVSVACRFHDHAAVAVDVCERGAHLFIEKPVSTTLEGLERVRKAHANAGILLAAMLTLRYDPAILAARQAVAGGMIGEVRLITTQKSYKLGARPDYYKTRLTYGGTIPWVGSHAIDLLAWFADLPLKTVFASHSTRGNRNHGELESTALCMFTFENEVLGSAGLDFLRPPTAPSHGDDRIRAAGTEGVVEVRDGKARLINNTSEGSRFLDMGAPRHIFADFLNEIRGDGKCLVSAEDSFVMTEACLLARQSADEGRIIKFQRA